MKKDILRTDIAINIINELFDLKIDQRGTLDEYNKILSILKLSEHFTSDELFEKVMEYHKKKTIHVIDKFKQNL
jgi:hypothetical protein